MKFFETRFTAILLVLASAVSAQALIVGTGGASVLVAAPGVATVNTYTHLTQVRVWNEQQDVALSVAVIADGSAPGTYDDPTDLGSIVVNAGTIVDSHFIHFDTPAGAASTANGFVTFADPIVGVMARGDGGGFFRLDDSDFLSSGTIYDNALDARGLEFISSGQSDRFVISPDGKTLQYHFDVTEPGDRIRVLTSAVPEPASMAGLFAGAACLLRRRRIARLW